MKEGIPNLYTLMRQDIIEGNLQAGLKLKPSELKSHYDVSINTLREALTRLSSDGFVESEDQKGFRVASISLKNLEDLKQMRVLLEIEGIKQSIANNSVEWEAGIVAAHYKLTQIENAMEVDEKANFKLWCQYDYEFHRALMGACNNKLIIDMHKTVFDQFRRYFLINNKVNGFDKKQISGDHKKLCDLVLKKETELCIKVLNQHINVITENNRSVLS
ncbi:MAG: GntR family transcriptional regulator [Arenicella sp.]